MWIQVARLAEHPDIVRTAVEAPGIGELMLARPRAGVDPRELDLGNLGYPRRQPTWRFRSPPLPGPELGCGLIGTQATQH